MPGAHQILYILMLSLSMNSGHALPHSKGLRAFPHRHQPETSQGMPSPATRNQQIEEQFMMWVRWMGTLNHSVFETVMNKVYPSFVLTVDKNPTAGDFRTIQAAVDSLPAINSVRVIIRVNAGIYREKVNIPATKSFITIEGAGADSTVVEWGDTAQTLGPNGHPIGTFNSATFAVNSPFFIAKNITFKRRRIWDFICSYSDCESRILETLGINGVRGKVCQSWALQDKVEKRSHFGPFSAIFSEDGGNTTPVPPPGAVGKQAVALRISGDTAAFVGCKFLGGQDTLYDHLGRHYYKDCYIEGSVDFIFGNGLSLFEGCHVHAIAQNYGALTAQNRMSLLDDTGFSFVNCRVTGSGVVYLGRAWGTFSRVIYAYTYMDNIIIPQGWYNWGDPSREMTVFYGQYKCLGPGANYAGRVAWSRELTDEEAKPFTNLNFVDGTEWIRI